MTTKTQYPRATRTVKIGDNHHRLLKILTHLIDLNMQDAVEVAIEQTLSDFLDGIPLIKEPFRDWEEIRKLSQDLYGIPNPDETTP